MDLSADIYNCAFLPEHTHFMLQHHTAWPWVYNEIVLDTARWAQGLPSIIEAIWFVPGSPLEQKARTLYRRFREHFPEASLPLLTLDVNNVLNAFAEATV